MSINTYVIEFELRLATDPGEMGPYKDGCPICRVYFETPAVQVQVLVDGTNIGPLCPACIEHLGQRNPDFPTTIEEYKALKKRYPSAIFDYEPPDDVWRRVHYYQAVIVGG